MRLANLKYVLCENMLVDAYLNADSQVLSPCQQLGPAFAAVLEEVTTRAKQH